MSDVWIVETGDYEQRHISAIFATEELAWAHIAAWDYFKGEEPSRYRVWAKPPKPVTHYKVEGVWPVSDKAQLPNWTSPHRVSFDSMEVHSSEAVSESRSVWWDGINQRAVYVEVQGNDEQAVEAAFAEQWEGVTNGARPEEIHPNG